MSDEHKPHEDEHGHDRDPAHEAPAHSADDHADAAPASESRPAGEGAAEPQAAAHDASHEALAPETAPDAAAADASGHPAPTSHDAPAAPAGSHDDHAHAAVAGAGVAAAATASSDRRPVWSDSGDAPFEDPDATPVYARGGKSRKKAGKKSGGSESWEIIKTIVFALLIALVLRVLLFQPFTIPSASMEPNLYEGDYIVVSKWSYGYSRHSIPFSPPVFEGRIFGKEPARGDIVVFKLPRDDRTDYIKRLIGLPGDRIQMIGNVLHINGAPVRDVVVSGQDVTNMYGELIIQAEETLPGGRSFRIQDYGPGRDLDDTPVFEVPAGHYFMMGDNRDNSVDSRVDESMGVGLVPAENLIGKAEVILFSWSPGASLWNPVSWFSKVRPSRFFTDLD